MRVKQAGEPTWRVCSSWRSGVRPAGEFFSADGLVSAAVVAAFPHFERRRLGWTA